MKKININSLIIYTSFFLFFLVATARPFISAILGNAFVIYVYMIAVVLLLLLLIRNKKISNKAGFFPTALLAMFLVSLYNNAYLEDGNLQNYIIYFLTVIYFVLLSFAKFNEKKISFLLTMFSIFAILTSIVSIGSALFPNWYIRKIIPLFPKENYSKIVLNFEFCNEKMGLSTNYSRNAFYMIIGLLINAYLYLKNSKKINLLNIALLFSSLLIIGKRSAFLFGIISIALAYFICNKKSLKIYLKFFSFLILAILAFFMIIKLFPAANYMIDRFKVSSDSDFTNGRTEIYNDVWQLFQKNLYMPLGWGQYAKSTNYTHPGVHNDYLQILCETGILGFIIIIGSDILFLIKAIKLSKENKKISYLCLSTIIFYILYATLELPHYDIETYMFYYLNVYIVYSEYKKIRMEKMKNENKQFYQKLNNITYR